ncbi:MAG: hypothetical protein ABI867_24400 [Kofleriaceae bacterium]
MHGSVLALALLAACGADSVDSPYDPITELGGVYTIATRTLNAAGCDGEGAAIGGPPHLFVTSETFSGKDALNVAPCDSISECQLFADAESPSHFGLQLPRGNDVEGWTVATAAFGLIGTECRAHRVNYRLTSTAAGIRLEARAVSATFAPQADNPPCPDEAALAATAAAPCEQFAVTTATFTTDL